MEWLWRFGGDGTSINPIQPVRIWYHNSIDQPMWEVPHWTWICSTWHQLSTMFTNTTVEHWLDSSHHFISGWSSPMSLYFRMTAAVARSQSVSQHIKPNGGQLFICEELGRSRTVGHVIQSKFHWLSVPSKDQNNMATLKQLMVIWFLHMTLAHCPFRTKALICKVILFFCIRNLLQMKTYCQNSTTEDVPFTGTPVQFVSAL